MEARIHWWETRAFMVAAILASAVPLLWPAIPPLTDLPGHIGRYRVMLGTDADVLSQWYRFHWRLVGNLGIDAIVAALGPLIGLEPAVKLAVIAIPVLTATGILWIAREIHGRVTPLALFALPLAYNFPFNYGFVNYALAMALVLNAFALWLRLGRQRRIGLRAALFVPISTIVWLTHVMGWGALGLIVYGAELMREREAGRRWPEALVRAALRCLPLALPALLLLVWRSQGGGLTERFFSILKISWLAIAVRDRWRIFDLGAALVLWALVYASVRDRRFERSAALTASCLMLALAALLLPFTLFGSAYADMRLVPYVLILALLAVRPGAVMRARGLGWLALAGLAFFAARTAGTTISYGLYGRSYERNLVALDHIPRGARLVSFVGETCTQRWAHTRLNHLPGLALARRAAFSNEQWPITGSALTTITAPAPSAVHFESDPSQMVVSRSCDNEPGLDSLDRALARLPRDAFDYLWLIEPPAFDRRLLAGMTPVWRDGDSAVYRIDKTRLSPPAPAH